MTDMDQAAWRAYQLEQDEEASLDPLHWSNQAPMTDAEIERDSEARSRYGDLLDDR